MTGMGLGGRLLQRALIGRFWRCCLAVILTVVAFALSAGTTLAAVSVTAATGGTAIPGNTAGGTWTNLTGPVITEAANREVGTGTIVLSAPTGFEFDTTATVTVTSALVSGSGTKIAIGAINTTATTISVQVTRDGASGTPISSITWAGIKVRPTAASANTLDTGVITKSSASTSTISGITNGTTSLGTLTEVKVDQSIGAISFSPATGLVVGGSTPLCQCS